MVTRREFGAMLVAATASASQKHLKALVVDGRNNHDWRATSPVLHRILTGGDLFEVDFATAPSANAEMVQFSPRFSSFDVIILNYTDLGNGGEWGEDTQSAFLHAVKGGKGVVVYHAASSAFPGWREYNRLTGLGGWGDRDERSGPYLHWKDGHVVRETGPAKAGHHGPRHEFTITARQPEHPILAGLPAAWMHASDELYDTLRGPAEELEVLATAWSDPAFAGTGRHEPMLFTVRYGSGRVFHITLGHDPEAMKCTGFQSVLRRGAEWAATGRVSQPVPADFPREHEVQISTVRDWNKILSSLA